MLKPRGGVNGIFRRRVLPSVWRRGQIQIIPTVFFQITTTIIRANWIPGMPWSRYRLRCMV